MAPVVQAQLRFTGHLSLDLRLQLLAVRLLRS
jgi:hypothetical protein